MWGDIYPEIIIKYRTPGCQEYVASLPLSILEPFIKEAFYEQINTIADFFISDVELKTTIYNVAEDKLGFVEVNFLYQDPLSEKNYVVSSLYFNFVFLQIS